MALLLYKKNKFQTKIGKYSEVMLPDLVLLD